MYITDGLPTKSHALLSPEHCKADANLTACCMDVQLTCVIHEIS